MKKIDKENKHSLMPTKIGNYIIFLIVLGGVFSLISIKGDYILAPPYAVSAYLIVFEHGTKYASRKSLAVTYLLVILLTDLVHVLNGTHLIGMLLSVIGISAFITFTDFSHPPAIALVIFSFLSSSILDFTISSLLSLVVLIVTSYLTGKYELMRRSRLS